MRCCAASFAAFLTLLSCSDHTGKDEVPGGRLAISVAPSTLELTKSGSSFSDWDEIGLSVVAWIDGQEQDLSGIRNEDNVCYRCSDGVFAPASSPAYYPDRERKCTFYSYYPYNSEGFDADANTLQVEVAADQSGYSSYMSSDYRVSVVRNVVPSPSPVVMGFSHILSRVTLNLVAGEGCTVEELGKIGISLKSLNTKAVYDMEKATLSGLSGKSDIKVYADGAQSTDKGMDGISAIVVPQTFRAGESMIYFEIYDKTLAYKPAEEIVFEPGKDHVFNITVTIENMGPSVSVSSEIRDWTDGGTVSGDADEESKFVGTVKDVEGNVYPYVEIDGLYWMAKNLMTATLNDGTAIEFKEAGNAEWMALETPAYTYFENNPDNLAVRGALYNYKVVETGKLCPEGWRLPSKDELSALIDEVDGMGTVDVATLVSPDWEGMGGTNQTGFSAMPCGLAMDHWYMDECYLWSSTVNESAENDMKYGYLYLSEYPWTDYHQSQVGMGVRCVKEK